MGNCQHRAAASYSLSVDLSQIDGLHPVISLLVDGNMTPRDLFNLIRHQLPKNAPSFCFQFSNRQKKIEVCDKPLSTFKLRNNDRLVLEFKDAKSMTQITVVVEDSGAKFTFWVKRDANVKSVLALISKTMRVCPDKLRLAAGDVELTETTSFDSVSSPYDLKLRMIGEVKQAPAAGAVAGLALEVVCEEATCLRYLQRQNVNIGLGTFEYVSGRKCNEVRCGECGYSDCSIEVMRFRECSVKFEGEKEDGSEESGSEEFRHVSGELLKGVRCNWRRLCLEVSPVL